MNSTDLTPAWILRAAAAYVLHNGLHLLDLCADPDVGGTSASTGRPTRSPRPRRRKARSRWSSRPARCSTTRTGPDGACTRRRSRPTCAAADPDGYHHGPWIDPGGGGPAAAVGGPVVGAGVAVLPAAVATRSSAPRWIWSWSDPVDPIPVYRHYQTGTPLCPVLDATGVGPCEPVLASGGA